MESHAHDPTSPTTFGWTRMEDGTAEDYAALTDNFNQHVRDSLVDHLFALLRAMQGPRFGYQVDRYRHSLQSGTRALRNGEDVEMVVAALLHDVGDVVAPANHSAVAADVLRPYVSDRTHWVIRHHGLFQGYYYFHHLGGDRDAREAFRDHEWFDDCAAFCHEYDQNCFDPDYDDLDLEEFRPLVEEVFGRPSRFAMVDLA
ncbi:MAG: HD domain-containing protein [Acidimicrobiales bacterium]|nr:phosphohydrolase [Acidimicrobiaceae bacterium]MBQ91507.1 phosphohydrolase [Acidimicrobiaceae bacterium]MDP6975194.1 HD domain-containing protein [Acidimicrobiales bacterium]|tara:strand:- start:320 stop:922 length:603 start_codon:yes stop_codon:yes gene_type:complete